MGAERTGQPIGIGFVGKSVLADVLCLWTDAANSGFRCGNQRIAGRELSADHGLGQADTAILGRPAVNEAPEAGNILLQLPEHEISTIAPEIAMVWMVLRRGQDVLWISCRIEEGPLPLKRTYEPPLDAFANAISFYVQPPRFAQVIRGAPRSTVTPTTPPGIKRPSGFGTCARTATVSVVVSTWTSSNLVRPGYG